MTDQYQTTNPTNSLSLATSVPLLTPAKYFDVTGGNDFVNLVEAGADRSGLFDQIPQCGCLNQISLLSGDDYLTDQDAGSFIFGHQGNDSIFGNGGNDLLRGGTDADQLDGGENNDTIAGDRQNDILTGGSGNDVFVWGKIGDDHDTITDFTDSADRIRLKNNLTYDDLTVEQVGSDVLIQTRPGSAVNDIFLTLQNVNINTIDSADFLTRIDSQTIHDSSTPLPSPVQANSNKSVITQIVPSNPYWGMRYPEIEPVVETPPGASTPSVDDSSGSTDNNTSNESSDSSTSTDTTNTIASKFAPYPDIDYSAFYSLGGGGGGGSSRQPTGGCDPAYPDFCIPPAPPDLSCSRVRRLPGYEPNFTVREPDPHNLDGDGDGIGCE
jgi:hypothetical protein